MTDKEQIKIMAKIIDDEKDICVRIHGLMDCKDCTCKDENGNCVFGDYIARTLFMEGCHMQDTEKNSDTQWHKVAERDLPQQGQEIRIYTVNKRYFNATYYDDTAIGGERFVELSWCRLCMEQVIAWTELPEYKEIVNNKIIISKEEYESLNKKIAELEQDLIHAGEKAFFKEQNLIIYEDKLKAQVRQETAEEIFNKIKNSYRETGVGILHSTKVYLDTLAKEYDADIDK